MIYLPVGEIEMYDTECSMKILLMNKQRRDVGKYYRTKFERGGEDSKSCMKWLLQLTYDVGVLTRGYMKQKTQFESWLVRLLHDEEIGWKGYWEGSYMHIWHINFGEIIEREVHGGLGGEQEKVGIQVWERPY